MFPVVLISSVFVLISGQEQDWSYHGERGPLEWPRLFPVECSFDYQSPININYDSTIVDPFLQPLEFEGYEQTLRNSRIINNGRTVEIIPNPNEDYIIKNGGLDSRYRLHNIHFHWGSNNNLGSEHAINGMKYPIEAHFVHINEKYGSMDIALRYDDGLAVLAVFYEISDISNQAIASIAEVLSSIRYANTERIFELGSSLDSLLPSTINRRWFYHYKGSLTTPNCTEAVIWTVFVKPQKITEQQLEEFREVLETEEGLNQINLVDNYRPLQPVNNRLIVRSQDFEYDKSTLSLSLLGTRLYIGSAII